MYSTNRAADAAISQAGISHGATISQTTLNPPAIQPRHLIAHHFTYVGLFLIALATLMYEILLTRIFSVTMWYHFAFVAVSIAMFGMYGQLPNV